MVLCLLIGFGLSQSLRQEKNLVSASLLEVLGVNLRKVTQICAGDQTGSSTTYVLRPCSSPILKGYYEAFSVTSSATFDPSGRVVLFNMTLPPSTVSKTFTSDEWVERARSFLRQLGETEDLIANTPQMTRFGTPKIAVSFIPAYHGVPYDFEYQVFAIMDYATGRLEAFSLDHGEGRPVPPSSPPPISLPEASASAASALLQAYRPNALELSGGKIVILAPRIFGKYGERVHGRWIPLRPFSSEESTQARYVYLVAHWDYDSYNPRTGKFSRMLLAAVDATTGEALAVSPRVDSLLAAEPRQVRGGRRLDLAMLRAEMAVKVGQSWQVAEPELSPCSTSDRQGKPVLIRSGKTFVTVWYDSARRMLRIEDGQGARVFQVGPKLAAVLEKAMLREPGS